MPTWDVDFSLHIDLTDYGLISGNARAEALAHVVRGVPIPPAVFNRLDRLNISRAVRGTTGIEGIDLSQDDVELIMSSDKPGVLGEARIREEREARNAAAVMRMIASILGDDPERPLTEDLIKEIHRLTTEGIEYPHNIPGAYRAHAVTAGDYVPPRDPDQVRELMARFVGWLNHGPGKDLPPSIRAIAAHFYFISIHPFGDGNGRTARAIESYLLYQGKINVVGFYSLSNFYYRRRADYVEMLDFVRFRSGGSLTAFTRFALDGLVEELEQVRGEIIRAVTEIVYLDFARSRISEVSSGDAASRMHHIVGLLEQPVAISAIRNDRHPISLLYRNLSPRTITRDLNQLEKLSLIRRSDRMLRRNLEVMNQFTR